MRVPLPSPPTTSPPLSHKSQFRGEEALGSGARRVVVGRRERVRAEGRRVGSTGGEGGEGERRVGRRRRVWEERREERRGEGWEEREGGRGGRRVERGGVGDFWI